MIISLTTPQPWKLKSKFERPSDNMEKLMLKGITTEIFERGQGTLEELLENLSVAQDAALTAEEDLESAKTDFEKEKDEIEEDFEEKIEEKGREIDLLKEELEKLRAEGGSVEKKFKEALN